MKTALVVLAICLLTTVAVAQQAAHPSTESVTTQAEPTAPAPTTKIVPGPTVFIAPMNGFENYLSAALAKKKVQPVPVISEDKAAYVISGVSEEKKAGGRRSCSRGKSTPTLTPACAWQTARPEQ